MSGSRPARVLEQVRTGGVRASARRLLRTVRTYGLRGTLRRAQALSPYSWYRLDLAAERPRRELEPGLEVTVCRTIAEAGDYAELQPDKARIAPERFDARAELWLVREGGAVLFACWIFVDRTPVGDAPGGWQPLPPGVYCLEDSITEEAARGRGVAPGTWTLVADDLARRGAAALITKVEDDNDASRRAIAKVGFVALSDLRELAGPAAPR